MLQSTWMDLVLGVDIHIMLVPTPAGPVPTPLPHPFTGLVLDPMGAAMNAAMGGGVVLVNGLFVTNCGTGVMNVPPHLPVPGPFAKGKPDNDAELWFGALNVSMGGSLAVRLGEIALSCSDPVRMPTSVVLAIPKGPLVLVPRPPVPDLATIAQSLGFKALGAAMKKAGKLLRKFQRGAGSKFFKKVSKRLRKKFSTLGLPDRVLSPGGKVYEPCERLTLEAQSGGRFVIRSVAGIAKHFEPHGAGSPGTPRRVARLVTIVTRLGVENRLTYDETGRLASVTDNAGRLLSFEYAASKAPLVSALPNAPAPKQNLDRITRVSVRGTDGTHHRVSELEYSPEGDLETARDALGHAYHYEYVNHLLVKETDKNGLSFYFQYDGIDASAKCIRTWGDGGIYDHVITYDTQKRVTLVENSLGENTIYQMDEAGQVVYVMDPAGRVTKYEYDEDSGQVIKEVDPAGGTAAREYDARGNLIRIVAPDGATLSLEYNAFDLPEHLIDALGNSWHWGYGLEGQVIRRVDPLGRHTQLHWRDMRLDILVDPAGQQTSFEYDPAGNVIRMLAPNGAESQWHYDGLGRCHTLLDPNGNRQVRDRDALGRVIRVAEPDGNERTIAYDPQSNVIRARDQQHDVQFEYRGVGRLIAREENGIRVAFQYDSEERLVAIQNEHGLAYRFVLDASGDVYEEYGFGGLRRRYLRDKAGRIAEVRRPRNRTTKYAYDTVGRVTAVVHDDGSQEVYAYRPDGELVVAENATSHIELERDALGRVIEERHGNAWIRSDYDVRGSRIRVVSSKGCEQNIHRNAMGDVLSVEVGVHSLAPTGSTGSTGSAAPLAQGPYRVSFERDRLGLELERRLPGGVRSRWSRDALGRPVSHEITVVGNNYRSRSYRWAPNDRLESLIDGARGPTRYSHDALGNLASITHSDGDIDLRLPDEVGNLFKSPDKADRKYGPSGELLESIDARGATQYLHDPEGYLVEKREPGDRVWKYAWNGSGMLARVERPDGEVVEFTYDPLGRRTSKTYRGKTTRWLWDGNVPLHEWVELSEEARERHGPTLNNSYEREIAAAKREALLARRSAQGPPGVAQHGFSPDRHVDADVALDEPLLEGTSDSPITWVFGPETFAPIAKLVADERYSIIGDHLGTPRVMFDIAGDPVWSAEIDAYGQLRHLQGPRRACPFRWPGQYEDVETGLYYNRFRYYDPEAGQYICSDPAGLAGGIRFFAYVRDPLTWADPLGLENIVFRALNPTDMSRLDAGESIAPKNPAANATPMDHVLHGSDPGYAGDQFVSVTKDRGLAESWARQHGTEVAEIDLDKVSSPVLDLSTGTGRTTHLGDASRALPNSDLYRANRFSRGAKEMLVEGEIPKEAVVRRYCS